MSSETINKQSTFYIAIAAHLAERGSKVLGIDKYDGGHSNGSSHGRSRIIRLAYYEDHRCKLRESGFIKYYSLSRFQEST